MRNGIRVLVADDHALVRAGLRLLLERQHDIRVVGEAGDGDEASQRAAELEPDVVVLDLTMPGTDAAATIRRIARGDGAGTAVVALSSTDGEAFLHAATTAGALGYVVKSSPERELVAAIREAAAHRSYVDAAVRRKLRHAPSGDGKQLLSPRETEALRFLALGYSNRQAAERMQVSAKTIETFRSRVSRKLGLKGRPALVSFALRTGLVSLEEPAADPEGGERRRS